MKGLGIEPAAGLELAALDSRWLGVFGLMGKFESKPEAKPEAAQCSRVRKKPDPVLNWHVLNFREVATLPDALNRSASGFIVNFFCHCTTLAIVALGWTLFTGVWIFTRRTPRSANITPKSNG